MATPTFFNAAFYLETYPDLVANGITLETAFDHFQQFGETELRVPSAEYVGKVNTSSVFDYVMANADLRAAFGVADDATALTKEQQNNGIVHYWTNGINEDRPDALIDYVPGPTPVETDLGAALEAITTANTELTATTKEVKEALDIVGTVNDASIKAAIQGKLEVVNEKGGAGFTVNPDATPTAKAAIIKAKQVELDAAEDVAKIQVTSTPGLQGKAQALASAQTAYETAVKAAAGNYEKFGETVANFTLLNGLTTAPALVSANVAKTLSVTIKAGTASSVTDPGTSSFYLKANASGKVVVFKTAVPASGAVNQPTIADTDVQATAAEITALKIKGLDDLVAATQGMFDNAKAFEVNATTNVPVGSIALKELALKQAMVEVLNAEKPAALTTHLGALDTYPLTINAKGEVFGTVKLGGAVSATEVTEAMLGLVVPVIDTTAPGMIAVAGAQIATPSTFDAKVFDGTITGLKNQLKSAEYTKAVKAAADFKAAAADYNDVAKYEADFTKATKAAEAAKDALVTQAEAEGVTLLIEGQDSATEGNDLFVNGGTTPATIFDFGKEGEDMFYFGPEFSFVRLADDAKLGTEVHGNATALEVFAQQVGNDVILSVELEAISGSSTKGFTGSEIKLAGVSLEDLNFADGFLTA